MGLPRRKHLVHEKRPDHVVPCTGEESRHLHPIALGDRELHELSVRGPGLLQSAQHCGCNLSEGGGLGSVLKCQVAGTLAHVVGQSAWGVVARARPWAEAHCPAIAESCLHSARRLESL